MAIPAQFPRIPVVHGIAAADKICPHDGTALEVIGRESAERYDYVPPQLRVLVDQRLKYACPCCHQGVKIAPLPPRLLPKSMASPSLLAHITTAKFVDGLPLTRQNKQFERMGVNLGPGTMPINGRMAVLIVVRSLAEATRETQLRRPDNIAISSPHCVIISGLSGRYSY